MVVTHKGTKKVKFNNLKSCDFRLVQRKNQLFPDLFFRVEPFIIKLFNLTAELKVQISKWSLKSARLNRFLIRNGTHGSKCFLTLFPSSLP